MSEVHRKLSSGHTVENLEKETQEKIKSVMQGSVNEMVRLQPEGWLVLRRYLEIEEKIYNFKFRPDDVVVMSFPKCGSTWMQEIVWNMRNNPNLDNQNTGDLLFMRSPFLEGDQFSFDGLFSIKNINFTLIKTFAKCLYKYWILPDFKRGLMLDLAEAHTEPRTIKTHVGISLLPKNMLDTCKLVYVYRNPMDNVLSAMHYYKLLKYSNFVGTQDDFVDLYVNDLVLHGPYWQHLREAWARRHHPNLFLTSYERLKKDIRGELKRLDEFLGTKLSEKQFDNVIENTSFNNMRKYEDMRRIPEALYNKEVAQQEGLLVRQGISGAWKDKITPEQKAKLDAWIKTNFTDHGITFEYEE